MELKGVKVHANLVMIAWGRNPFNGIERFEFKDVTTCARQSKNPFNGIESF